jgi:hypothetical protein
MSPSVSRRTRTKFDLLSMGVLSPQRERANVQRKAESESQVDSAAKTTARE